MALVKLDLLAKTRIMKVKIIANFTVCYVSILCVNIQFKLRAKFNQVTVRTAQSKLIKSRQHLVTTVSVFIKCVNFRSDAKLY